MNTKTIVWLLVSNNKTYYNDRDLKPTEDFMLSITLIPLTSIEQKVAN